MRCSEKGEEKMDHNVDRFAKSARRVNRLEKERKAQAKREKREREENKRRGKFFR